MKRLTTFILLAACIAGAKAQLTFEGQYRARGEVRNGFKKPILEGEEPAAFIEHRARIAASYKKDKVGFKLSVQDIRIWGETGQINKSDQLLSAHEAYADYYASEKSTFRIGRQEMAYDGHRFIGTLDWAMQARSFDAVRYMYKDDKGNQFDLMASWNQAGYGDGLPEPAKLTGNNYNATTGGGTNNRIFNLGLPKSQLMAYYKKSFDKNSIGFMLVNDMYQSDAVSTRTHSNLTFGLTPDFVFGDVKAGGQFYYTGGTFAKVANDDGSYTKVDLAGYMFNLYVQLPKVAGSPLIGVDYLSGDDSSTGDKLEGWSPSYGTNHKFYGFMDYFYVGNGHGGANAQSAGLLDIYLKTSFKISEKSSLMGHLHYFSAPEERTNATTGEAYSGSLGTELDLVYSYKIAPEFTLKAGYSQMFGISDAMKQLKFGNPSSDIKGTQAWGWIMVAFTPKFL
nr:alginate export family protein [uncultured Carboxylicivirga sp.]